MVYTDGVHLVAESVQELLEYAHKIGLNTQWMHLMGKLVHPHFDICGKVKQRVLADEQVKQVSKKEIVRICKLNFRPPETDEELDEWEAYHTKKIEEIEMPTKKDFDRMFENILRKTRQHC